MAGAPSRGLGKGLGALIPGPAPANEPHGQADAPEQAVADAVYLEIPVDEIAPNPRQPRTVFDEDALAELVHSIREIGLLQPVVVRRAGSGYELIAGERRLRASREAGLPLIPAIVRQTDDDDLLRDALLENLHRADLNALEEAAAYQQLLEDFGCTQEELARRIGRSRPQVTNTLRLLRLPTDVQRRVAAGVLSAGHARALLSLDETSDMEALAGRIVAEGLSVRSVEEIILLGEADGRARARTTRSRRPAGADQQVADAVANLVAAAADALDTRVEATGFSSRNGRGRLVVECADVDDLRRIVALLDGR
jgi:ParB family chromosome partitioning protein